MITTIINKEEYRSIKQINDGVYLLMFSKEDVKNPIYDKDEEGHIKYDENNNPVIIGYEETDLCKVTEEYVYGELTSDKVRKIRLKELEEMDSSSRINEFTFRGKPMWFDKVTRTCIVYSMQTESAVGKTDTELYDNDGVEYTLPITTAIELFGAVELYAKDCYNVTASHKASLLALDNINDIVGYDITFGYPKKLEFK